MPNETKYQPDINQLDVRCGGQLVRDGHVESVQHGRNGQWDQALQARGQVQPY